MRDPRVEAYLKSVDVDYDYRAKVALRTIQRDPTKPDAYQARMLTSTLNPDTVDLYAQAMKAKTDFPAPVLAARKDSTLDVLGGFHRVNAALRAGRMDTDAYVLNVERKVADRIARTLNTLEAVQGSSKSERVHQARRLIDLHGYAVNKAASECGIATSLLETELRAIETAERLQGKVDTSGLSTAHLAEMHGVQNDIVLEALAQITVNAKIAAAALRPVITEIRTARTEASAMDMVRAFKGTPLVQERLDIVAAGGTRKWAAQRRSSQLFRAINAANNLIARYPDPVRMGLTEPELMALRQDYARLSEKMGAFFGSPAIVRSGNNNADARGVPSSAAASAR